MSLAALLRTLGQPISRLSLGGWQAYVFGATMVWLAVVVRWVLPEGLGTRVPFPTFFLAVFLSAWVGGWRAGLFASVLTVICGVVVFPITKPPWDWRDFVALSFVFSVCVVGAYACARLRASTDVIEKDRAWYERILDRVGDAVLVVDARGCLRYYNQEAASLWGLDDRCLGRSVDESIGLWFEGRGARFEDLGETIRTQQGSWELPLGLEVKTGGRPVPVVGNVSRFLDPEYGDAAIVSVQGVQALRDAARLVEATERRMRALFESDIVGLFSIDGRGRISTINGAMLRLLGYAPAAGAPERLHDIADEVMLCLLGVDGSENAISHGPFDCKLRGRSGDEIWVSLGVVPITNRERMVFVTDIRARKQAERDHIETKNLLQIIIDQVPALVSFVTPEGRTVLANRYYREFTGHAVDGEDWRTGLATAAIDSVSGHLPGIREGGSCEFTLQAPSAAQGVRDLQVHLVPYRPLDEERAGVVVYAYDITDRLTRERDLASSEARFRQLAEASSAVVWQASSSGKLTAQIGWCEFIGGPRLSSIEQWLEWVHPGDLDTARHLIAALRVRTTSCEAEFRLRHASGTYRYVNVRAVILDEPREGSTEWIGTIRDIHQRRTAEEALASKEIELRLILNAVPARIAYLNADAELQWANRNFTEWFDFHGDIKGRSLEDVMPREVVATLYKPLQVARRGFVSQEEWMEIHPVQGLRWTTTTFSPDLDEQGRVRGVISLCMDSTQRHETEDALRRSDAEHRTLAENVPHMVWMADDRGALQYCNSRWLEYTGHPSTGHFADPMHPSDRREAERAFGDATRSRTELGIEVRYRRASDGAYRWHLVRAMPLLHAEGNILRWYGTCTDIEDQKVAQETLREAHSRTNHFLATLSHELRNPLAALMASTAVLEHAVADDDRRRESVRAIQRQSWHLKKLMDDLLDISRITLGKIQMATAIVDLSEICRHVCEDFSEKADRYGVSLDCEVPEEPLLVQGDPTRIRQCIDNLVSNAIKASAHNMKVRVRARLDGRFAEIVVMDEGVGVEEDARATIFLPFSQADEWRNRGLGLGLSIVSRLVELHGGSVWVESAGRNMGATFGVRLPLASPRQAAPKADATLLPASPLTGKILIVDDETDNAVALQYLLALDGHDVYVAEDGIAALAMAESIVPDVVICDVGLPPPMNGLEVAGRLRARFGSAVHLCAYSGYGSQDDIARSLAAGFDAHLTKPGTPSAIAAEVQRGLGRAAAASPIGK